MSWIRRRLTCSYKASARTNEEGEAIQRLVARALETGEREETTVHVIATVPKKLGDEPVAKFALTLSIKRKK